MTREEFVKRWRYQLTGFALFGYVSDRKDDAMERAKKIFDMPAEIEKFLGKMYDDLAPKPEQPKK